MHVPFLIVLISDQPICSLSTEAWYPMGESLIISTPLRSMDWANTSCTLSLMIDPFQSRGGVSHCLFLGPRLKAWDNIDTPMNFKGKLYFTLMIAMDSYSWNVWFDTIIIGKAYYDFYLSYCLFWFLIKSSVIR